MPWLAALGGAGGAAGAGAGAAGAGAGLAGGLGAGAGAGAGLGSAAAGAAGGLGTGAGIGSALAPAAIGFPPGMASAAPAGFGGMPQFAGMTGAEGASMAVPTAIPSGASLMGGAPAAAGPSGIMQFLGQGGSGNNFLRGLMQGYTGMPMGSQPFGWNATTLGQTLGQFGQAGGGQPMPMPQQPPRNQQFQQILQMLAQQRAKMNPYSAGGGGLF